MRKYIRMNRYLQVLMLLMICHFAAFSQSDFSNDTFMVVKAYQPTLIDAKKINFEPTISDTLKIEQDLNYRFIAKEIPVKTEVEPITAARVKSEPLIKLYNGYAKLGLGNNYTPWAEVYYHNLRSDEYSLGTHLKYSYFNGIDNLENTERSDGHFEVFGKKFGKGNTFEGSLAYDLSKLKYYGFPADISEELTKDVDIDQNYNLLSGNFKLSSTIRDSFNLRHKVDLGMHYLSSKRDANEWGILALGNLSKIENSELYNLDIGVDHNSIQNKWDSLSNIIVSLKPSIKTTGDLFSIKGGMSIFMQAENTASFTFYPEVEFTANVIDNILVPYAGVNGGIQRNSNKNIIQVNPYVSDSLELRNSNRRYNAYFGLRGTLSSRIAFNANFTKRKTDDFLMYVKDTSSIYRNEFVALYDEVEEMIIKAELSYSVNTKLRLYLIAEYFGYNPKKETEVWHQTDKKLSLLTVYNLRDKIITRIELMYFGDQYAKTYGGLLDNGERKVEKLKLDGIFDANISLEYRYTKRVSAFINFNNIAGSSYQRWQDYRLQKFNLMGGFSYAF